MRSKLRLFALVGVLATAVDFLLLVVLSRGSMSLWLADVIALMAAAFVAYVLNRSITFRGDPMARWVSNPGLFAVTAGAAGLVDLSVLALLDGRGSARIAVSKVLAIGCAAIVRWVAYRWILFKRVRKDLAQRVVRPQAEGDLRLSVVVPAYNEGELIAKTVAAIDEELDRSVGDAQYEVLVVDDGSADNTIDVAERAGARVVAQETNQGKGAAVRAGVLAARGRTVVFTDADLAYPPSMVTRIMTEIEDGWDMVVGSRRHRDTATLVRPRRIREFGGRMVNRLTHLVLLGHFRDTQCGIKGFQGDVARVMFQRTRIDGFAFDVELFLIAEQDHLSLMEIPVSVQNRPGSSVSIVGDTLALLNDLFRIRRWVGEGVYRPNHAQRSVLDARV